MSASVMAGPPDLVGESDELIGGQCGDRAGVRNALRRPDVDCVAARTETQQSIFKTRLFRIQRVDAKPCCGTKQRQCSVAKIPRGVVDKGFGTAEQPPVF